VCAKSPLRPLVDAAIAEAQQPAAVEHPLVFRNPKNARARIASYGLVRSASSRRCSGGCES
jgi:hypothetical protein